MTGVVINDVIRDAPRAPAAPIDPGVRVPDAVRRATELAESFYKQSPTTPAPNKEDVVQPGAEPPAAPVAADPAQPEPPITPSPHLAPVEADTEASFERKYASQQGRIQALNKEVRDTRALTTQLGQELANSTRFIRDLQARLEQRDAAPLPRLLTPEEQSDFGEFIPVAQKAAREVLDPKVQALEAEVQQLRHNQTEIMRGGVWASLDQRVPEWRSVNNSPEFKQWLNLYDPMSGYIRKALLDDAFANADAQRVVNIFSGFVAASAARRPAAPNAAPAPTPATASAKVPAVSLETLAAPGRARSAPGAPAADKPVYTAQDFTALSERRRRGLIQPDEADRIERDMHAALKDGRFQQSNRWGQ